MGAETIPTRSLPKRARRPASASQSPFDLEALEPRTLLSADVSGAAQSFAPEPVTAGAPLVLLADTSSAASAPGGLAAPAFGRFGASSGDAAPQFTFQTHDGTSVTFSLDGPGSGELLQEQNGPSVRLHGTDEGSFVRILTEGGAGRVTLDNVSIEGALGSLIAPTARLVGVLAAQGPIGSLALGSVEGGTISAPSTRGLTVLGDISQGTLLIGAQLGNDARIGGTGPDADLFGPGSIAALYVGGSMNGTTVRIGQDPVDGTFDNGNDALRGGPDSAVTFIKINGALSADTRFVGGAFPSVVQLGGDVVPLDGRFITAIEMQSPTQEISPAIAQPASSPVDLADVGASPVPAVAPGGEEAPQAPLESAVQAPTGVNPPPVSQSLVTNADVHDVASDTENAPPAPLPTSISSSTVVSPAPIAQSLGSNADPNVAAAAPSTTTEWDSVVALWKAHMLDYGRRHGQELADLASGTPQDQKDATYYDAERVFYQIAAYTGDPAWVNYAQIAERYYRDNYVVVNGGTVPGYWNFTEGLRMDYEQTHDAASRQAVMLLSQNAAFANPGTPVAWTESAEYSREVAYAIISYVDAEALGAAPIPRKAELIDQAMRHIDQWFVSKSTSYMPFMVGLTTEALIHAYDQSPDSRIQAAVATALDGLWREAWLPSAAAFYYAGTSPTEAAPDLNMLIAPAYAWLYRQTGDVTYRERGDAIFAGGANNAFLQPIKQFNQNYMWSFDYLRYRGV
jgi:hypothetical protein